MDNITRVNKEQQEKPTVAFKWGFTLYVLALLIYPYIFIIHYFFPSTYSFGVEKSIAVAIITVALIFAFLLQGRNIIAKLGKKELYFYIFIFVSLLTIRFLVYQEQTTVLIKYRVFILPIIYAGLACYYLADQKKRQLTQKIILWQTLIQAIFGIFLWNFIYTGIISHTVFKLWEGGGRMGGTLISANLFPGFLLLGAFVLISPYLKWRLSHSVKIVLLLIFIWAIVYSNSRLPLFVGTIILLIAFKDALIAKKNYFVKTLVIIFVVNTIFFSNFWLSGGMDTTIDRTIGENPNIRLIKYKLGLGNVLENILGGFLIGSTRESMHNRVMVIRNEGIAFSDNSFILMMELLGIFITFLYILLFISIIRRTTSIKVNYFFIFYFISALFFNSSISWDFWLVFIFATLYSLQPNSCERVSANFYGPAKTHCKN